MPTYEYVCKNCGHRFDVVQSMQDESLTLCPNCGEPQLRKVFAPPAISFKGSGFYATDHGSKAKPRDGANDKGDERQSGAAAKDGGSKGGKESGSGDSSSDRPISSGSSSSDSSSSGPPSSGSSSSGSSSSGSSSDTSSKDDSS